MHKPHFIRYRHTKPVFIHIACWLLFIGYEWIVLSYSTSQHPPYYQYIIPYLLNILFFYAQVGLLHRTFNRPRTSYIQSILLLTGLFTLAIAIKLLYSLLTGDLVPFSQANIPAFRAFLVLNLARTGYFAILATFYWAAGHIAFYRRQTLEAEKQQLLMLQEKTKLEMRLAESVNAYLQQQINPHMLFNSLNFIYNRVHQYSPEAARSVFLLSDIMRFCLEAGREDGKVALEDEIGQLYNLIEINRQRYGPHFFLETDIQEDLPRQGIIPLILFTLTENIFKHGNLRNKAYPALLRIRMERAGELRYYARNLKKRDSGFRRLSSIGIRNIRTRLDYSYPGNYSLDLSGSGEFFETTLILRL